MEQKWMEGDLEYARAVLNLHQGICDKDNLGLFNSQHVWTPVHPFGVDLGEIQDKFHEDVVTIVDRNKDWHLLNHDKIIDSSTSVQLIWCSTLHKRNNEVVPEEVHSQYLLDNTLDDHLLSLLDMYIGTPVILCRHHNIQDLCITNGVQGELHSLHCILLLSFIVRILVCHTNWTIIYQSITCPSCHSRICW